MGKFILCGLFEVAESGRDHRDLMRVAVVNALRRVMDYCLFWNGRVCVYARSSGERRSTPDSFPVCKTMLQKDIS